MGLLFGNQSLELFFLELFHGFRQDALVHVEAQVVDEATLLGPKQVAGAPNVQVAHGDLHARAEV